MDVTQYIGARYVPKFYENAQGTSDWTANTQYEPLTIVTRNGNSYTSKKPVPANIGAPDLNPDYWVSTGIYNQQVEQLRQDVLDYKDESESRDEELSEDIKEVSDSLQAISRRRFIFIGDSYAEGYTPDGVYTGWPELVATKLGLTSSQYSVWYRGGSGFVENTQGRDFLGLLNDSTDSDPSSITDVVVAGGYNDNTKAQAAIMNAISVFCGRSKEKYPNARVWIGEIGWSSNPAFLYPLSRTVRNYIEGAANAGAAYMSNVEYSLHEYYTLFASDRTHPNQNGQNAIARSIAQALLTGSANVYKAYGSITIDNPRGSVNNFNSIACMVNNGTTTISCAAQLNMTFTEGQSFQGASGATLFDLADITGGFVIGSSYDNLAIPVHATVKLGDSEYHDVAGTLVISGSKIKIAFKKVNATGNGWQVLNNAKYLIIERFSASFDSLMC